MATRRETKQFLYDQLKKLHEEEHVDDLMKAGRVEELEEIAKELDFSGLEEFLFDYDNLFLEVEEIPADCYYELAFYINNSDYRDYEIFDDEEEVEDFLTGKGETLAKMIAEKMEYVHLTDLSLEELLVKKLEEIEYLE